MSLESRLKEDLKDAMRQGDAVRRDTLRMVLADLKNRRIELGRDLEEADVEAVLSRAVRTRQDSYEQYSAAGRSDLSERERAEIGVVQAYLPQQMSADEVREAVRGVIAELGATSRKDTGSVMKALMARYKGRIDGKAAGEAVAELLG